MRNQNKTNIHSSFGSAASFEFQILARHRIYAYICKKQVFHLKQTNDRQFIILLFSLEQQNHEQITTVYVVETSQRTHSHTCARTFIRNFEMFEKL